MDPATLIGIVMAMGALLFMMIMEGSSPLAIVLIPAMVLVFGGTFGAAIAAPKVPPKTRISGGSRMIARGLEPSMIMSARSETIPSAIPMRVAGSTDQRSSRCGNGTTEDVVGTASGADGARYSPRSIS